MNKQSGKGTTTLLIVLIVALGIVWFIHDRMSKIKEPAIYEFTVGDTSYRDQENTYDNYEEVVTTEEGVAAQEAAITEAEAEIGTITETSESTDLSDIETDLDFDLDGALNTEDLDL